MVRPFGIAAQAVDLFNHPVWGVQLPGQRNAASFGEESCGASVFIRHRLCRVGWRDCGHGCNPSEVVLVRMCADGAKPTAQRFGYTNAIQGLMRVWREEGLRTFSRGLAPNIARSVLMNVSQIATYAAVKSRFLSATSIEDGVPVHIISSLVAGTVATTVCAPADVLKSRIQSSAAATAKGPKLSILQIVQRSLKVEGLGFLMKGWTPAWLRLTPNTVLMFVFMEQLQRLLGFRPLSRSKTELGLPTKKGAVATVPYKI